MATRPRDPKGLKALEIKFRGLALEDGLWDAAEALAAQVGGPPKLPRPRKSSSQFPFATALAQHLRAMEARYGALLDGAPDATIVANGAGEIILLNARAAQHFGQASDALLGSRLGDIVAGPVIDALLAEGVDAALAAAGNAVATGFELTGMRSDGSRFPAEAMASRVDDEDGKPLLVLTVRDSGARMIVERRLADAERHLHNLIEALPDAIVLVNKRGRISFANAQFAELVGLERTDVTGRAAADVLPTELVEAMGAILLAPDHPPAGASVGCRGTRGDGTALSLEARIAVLRDFQGTAAIASIRDLAKAGAGLRQDLAAEDLHRRLLDASPEAMVVVDQHGDVVAVNRQLEQRFGFSRDDLIGQPVIRILPQGLTERLRPDPLSSAEVALAQAIGSGIEIDGRRKDGGLFPLEAMLSRLDLGDGTLTIATLRDISVRRATERRKPALSPPPADPAPSPQPVAVSSHLAEVTLNAIGDALVSADLAGNVSFVNFAAAQLTGWSWQEASGRPVSEILRIVDAGTRISVHEATGPGGIRRIAQLHPNVVLIRRDGTEVPVEGSVAPIEDQQGEPAGRVLIFRDVSLARARAEAMAHSAQHDALTGLPNRLLLNDRIDTAIAIAPRHNKQVSVLFLDLDGFKRINDSLGHAVGDKLLQGAGGRLLSCVRGSDTVSRIGGDEFVVVLSEVERAEDSAISARRLLEALSQPYSIDGHDLRITASIGVAVYPEDGTDAESLIKSADAAMYQAKENGRHGYQFYKPAMNLRAVERQEVEDGLRWALEREEFSLHFQPKVDLHTGKISGAEALLRWVHPTRGPVPPSLFMPIAETSGLIQPIGAWVLREACRQTHAWHEAGLKLPTIAVNVSAIEFTATRFLDDVFDVLNGTGLDPRALEIELTESVLMRHVETSNAVLQALRAGGVQMSVDDFGTGYSSLSHLHKFPIHMLKIDQSFVREITASEGDASVVTAVLNMAQSLNLKVVAEGVETPEELAFLQLHRCDEAQGFYFSRPLPAPQFGRLLRDGLLRTMAARKHERPAEIAQPN